MEDSTTGLPARTRAPAGGSEDRDSEPLQVAEWVASQAPRLTERWYAEVRGRNGRWREPVDDLVREFLGFLVSLVPGCLGPYRDQMDAVWRQAAELYGKVGAMRGLAAGEVIEEMQLLREMLIRFLYIDPPGARSPRDVRLSLRDGLHLSRIVDRGVTHASVGHTDALFFALFHGNGVAQTLDQELVTEVRNQLGQLEAERDELLRLMRG